MADMVAQFTKKSHWPNSRTVSINDIRDYDLSAKNPAKITETIHRSPAEILADIDTTNETIIKQTAELKKIIGKSL